MVFRIEAFHQGEVEVKDGQQRFTRSDRKNRVARAHASMFGLLVMIPMRQYFAHAASLLPRSRDTRSKAYFTRLVFHVGIITDHDYPPRDPKTDDRNGRKQTMGINASSIGSTRVTHSRSSVEKLRSVWNTEIAYRRSTRKNTR